jgi:hypothetical protein
VERNLKAEKERLDKFMQLQDCILAEFSDESPPSPETLKNDLSSVALGSDVE